MSFIPMLSCPEHEESRAAANLFVHTMLRDSLGAGYLSHAAAHRVADWMEGVLYYLFELEDMPASYPFTWSTFRGKQFYIGFNYELRPLVGCRACSCHLYTDDNRLLIDIAPRFAAEIILDKHAKQSHVCSKSSISQ